MSNISIWIISVTVATLVGALTDVVLPNGKMNRMIKSVMGLFIMIVIIAPIKSVDLSKLDLSQLGGFNIDKKFIEQRSSDVLSALENEIEGNLQENGYTEVSIKINGKYNGGTLEVYSIYVDLSNIVITEDSLNINKYTNIVAIIKKSVDVEEENVIFYE